MFNGGMKRLARERGVVERFPYVGHRGHDTVRLDDGSTLAIIELEGQTWETADPRTLHARYVALNSKLRNIRTEGLVLSSHVVRGFADPGIYPTGTFRSAFARSLDAAYRQRLQSRTLYRNRLYLCVLFQPPEGFKKQGNRLRRLFGLDDAGAREGYGAALTALEKERMQDMLGRLESELRHYGPRRLGTRVSNGRLFSEVFEALNLIQTGIEEAIPLVHGHQGRAMYNARFVAEWNTVRIIGGGGDRYAACLGLQEYPAVPVLYRGGIAVPGTFDNLLNAKFSFVLTQTFGFMRQDEAQEALGRKQNRMSSAGDKAVSQAAALSRAVDHLAGNEFVFGVHNLGLTVFADTRKHLDQVVSEAMTELAAHGSRVAREDLGLEASYFGGMPGNADLHFRSGPVSSRNFAAMSPFHNYPIGAAKGRWGSPIAMFRTTGGTPYRLHFHVRDVGTTIMFGPTGGGKTTLLMLMLALAEKAGIKIVFFDGFRGGEIFIRAIGGIYMPLSPGKPTGSAPLRALSADSREDMDHLNRLTRGMIVHGGGYTLTPEDERALGLGLDAVMALPPADRSFSEVRAFLGQSASGAGARLDKWCWGKDLGWVLDCPVDTVDMSGHAVGFDISKILDHEESRGPLLSYLFYRLEKVLDGSRVVIPIDEAWKPLADPAFGGMINATLKTVRRRNGVPILATQSPADMLRVPYARSLIQQAPNQIAMPDERADPADYVDGLKYTPAEFDLIKTGLASGGQGRFLLKQGRVSVALDANLDGMQGHINVLSTRDATLPLMEQLIAEHGPHPDGWVEEFMRQSLEISA